MSNNFDDPNDLGSTHDVVQIQLGDDELKAVESYEVGLGVFTQPSGFAVVLGDGATAGFLYNRYKPRTPFKLFVNGNLVQTGLTDSRAAGGQAAGFLVRGRDMLQEIHDSYTPVEKTYKDKRHIDLIKSVFKDAKMPEPVIYLSNEANRKEMALGHVLPSPARAKEEVVIPLPVQMKMGDTYYSFIKRILDRAGLFLFAGRDGSFVLTAPDKNQPPLYRLVHAPDDTSRRASVTNVSISDSTVGRAAYYVVYSRGGGKKFGRVKFKDNFEDPDMVKLGYERIRTFRDWHIQSNAQAELMARRRLADERRKSFSLLMTVVGHTTVSLSGQRAVWTPDTMVEVDSDELGLHGPYYIESVTFRRGGDGTTTALNLMQPGDLEFGLEETD